MTVSSGYALALESFGKDSPALVIRDRRGVRYPFQFAHQTLDNGCSTAVHALVSGNLLASSRVQFGLGSSIEYTSVESELYDGAGRILMHCCAPDVVYEQDLAYVYGVQSPSRSYAAQGLRFMVMTGAVRQLAVLYRTDDPYSAAVCQGAIASAVAMQQGGMAPNLQMALVLPYSAVNISSVGADPAEYYRGLARQVVAAKADGVVACDGYAESGALVGAMNEAKQYLRGFFLATGPPQASWVAKLGSLAEGLLGAAQWHAAMRYTPTPANPAADPADAATALALELLGSSSAYTASYAAQFSGAVPDARAAAASAAFLSLALAISTAFTMCDLSRVQTSDQLLFSPGLLDCDAPRDKHGQLYFGPVYGNVTGYELVRASLSQLRFDSFFGPVSFDQLRRNSELSPGTIQILNGRTEVIFPVEAASRSGVMPSTNSNGGPSAENGGGGTGGGPYVPPSATAGPMPSEDQVVGSLTKEAAITVLVLVVVVLALVALMTVLLLRRRKLRRQRQPLDQLVAISYNDLTDIRAPVQVMSGWPPDFETGYAKLKGQYVALRPLVDYYSSRPDRNALREDQFLLKGQLLQRPRFTSMRTTPPPGSLHASIPGAGPDGRPVHSSSGACVPPNGPASSSGGGVHVPSGFPLGTTRLGSATAPGALDPHGLNPGGGGEGGHHPMVDGRASTGSRGLAFVRALTTLSFKQRVRQLQAFTTFRSDRPLPSLLEPQGPGGALQGALAPGSAPPGAGGSGPGGSSSGAATGHGGVPGGALAGSPAASTESVAVIANGRTPPPLAAVACGTGTPAIREGAASRLRRASTCRREAEERTSAAAAAAVAAASSSADRPGAARGPLSVVGRRASGTGRDPNTHVTPGAGTLFTGGGASRSSSEAVAAMAGREGSAVGRVGSAASLSLGPGVGAGLRRILQVHHLVPGLGGLAGAGSPFQGGPNNSQDGGGANTSAEGPASESGAPQPRDSLGAAVSAAAASATLRPGGGFPNGGGMRSGSVSVGSLRLRAIASPLQSPSSASRQFRPGADGPLASRPSGEIGARAPSCLGAGEAEGARGAAPGAAQPAPSSPATNPSGAFGSGFGCGAGLPPLPPQPPGPPPSLPASVLPPPALIHPHPSIGPASGGSFSGFGGPGHSSGPLPAPLPAYILPPPNADSPGPPRAGHNYPLQPPGSPAFRSSAGGALTQGGGGGGGGSANPASAAMLGGNSSSSGLGPPGSSAFVNLGTTLSCNLDGRSSYGSTTPSTRVSASGLAAPSLSGGGGAEASMTRGMGGPPPSAAGSGVSASSVAAAAAAGSRPARFSNGGGGVPVSLPMPPAPPGWGVAGGVTVMPGGGSQRLPQLLETEGPPTSREAGTASYGTSGGGNPLREGSSKNFGVAGGASLDLLGTGQHNAAGTSPDGEDASNHGSAQQRTSSRSGFCPRPLQIDPNAFAEGPPTIDGGPVTTESRAGADADGGPDGPNGARNATRALNRVGSLPFAFSQAANAAFVAQPGPEASPTGLELATPMLGPGGYVSANHRSGPSQIGGTPPNALVAGGTGSGVGGWAGRRLISSKKQLAHIIWRLTRLQHPNVLPVLGIVWDFAGLPVPVLVTQYEEFGSLSGLLDNSTVVIDISRRLDIINDVANALRYLYAQDDLIFNGLLGANNWRVYLDKRFKAKVEVTIASIALESPVFQRGTRPHSATHPSGPPAADGAHPGEPEPSAVFRPYGDMYGKMPGVESAEPDDVYQFGLMALTLLVDTPVSLLGPSLEQLEAVRAVSATLADVVDACTASEAADRPTFADIVGALATVTISTPPPFLEEEGGDGGKGGGVSSKRQPQGFRVGGMSEEELYEAFPPSVAEALKQGKEPPAEPHEEVSIFFSDIVGYTNHCSRLQTHEVMDMLNRLYTRFDAIIKDLQLFKVDVIGDAYLAVGNIRVRQPDSHARRLLQFAFQAIQVANSEPVCVTRPELGTISIRVGLHVGPVMACVVGTMNRRYSLFGNTVNVASRMESTSEPNKVQCTTAYKQLVRRQWPEAVARSRGFRNIKGKGLMETFFLFPPDTPISAIGPSVLTEELELASRASSEGSLAHHLANLNLKRFQTLPRPRPLLVPPTDGRMETDPGSGGERGERGAEGGVSSARGPGPGGSSGALGDAMTPTKQRAAQSARYPLVRSLGSALQSP
ncbi:hypothetical protein HYH03_008133 [Edaphochlamys debaryana]|uniref:guanylate cyclase n=1 Tax=Edaphochlamys debaryana TaxID=47281 RepID=A0A836BYA3_9CHLO|nr:hypothetical protein HYH03_008133 [Edaphochlamys debaryana]|eukprot:KAG2493616.1 hypothetical protein HYH03_008133 [Edaphochlamys debaryana]